MFLSEQGEVYSFGGGRDGQIGHGNTLMDTSTPSLITSLKDQVIVSAYCGQNHTALVNDEGQMYTCGDGRYGKLALGEENFANQFRAVKVPRFQSFIVQKVRTKDKYKIFKKKSSLRNSNTDVKKII